MHKSTLMLFGLAGLIASCESPKHSTMELLRAGDPKICVAADVETALQKLVLPKERVSEDYIVSFSDATLETFDKVVSKAACHANIKIDAPSGEIVKQTGFDFTVVPSAQSPETFVVSASLDGYRDRLAAALARDAADKEAHQNAEKERTRLVATVKEGWLRGRWVASDLGTEACLEGPYYEFARDHGFHNETGPVGTWRLEGLRLTVIGTARVIDSAIDEAEIDSFASHLADGTEGSFRRCSRQEMTSQSESDPEEAEDTSEIDAVNPTSGN